VKWYKHDPAAFLEGCIGLNAEERGGYITLLCLIYARAPKNHVTDELVCSAMHCRPQVWRRLKASLMAKGKVQEVDGHLTANRVQTTIETTLKLIANRARSGRVSALKQAEIKWLAPRDE
jgi:hypothetical protein